MQVNCPPPVVLSATGITTHLNRRLTVVGCRRHAATTLAIDVADVLLEARVGDAARSRWYRPASVLRTWCGEGEGGEGEDGEDGELHIGGWVSFIVGTG